MISPWQRRIDRAEELARQYPISAELLHFYQDIARFQSTAAGGNLEPLQSLIRTAEDPLRAFYDKVLRQALVGQAFSLPVPDSRTCPSCGEKPVAAVLRPEGEGAKRSLLCSLCFTEWEFRRLLCPSCGEEDKDKLPIFTAEEFPHVRVEACDTCRTYIKAIDLTKNGLAVPEVDELAAVPLDLWATEGGYTKLQTNLFGL